jgi:tetratricopeptide (TPR) repeat protein
MKYLVALLICCFSNMLYGQDIEKLLQEAHTLEVTFKEKAALEKYIEVQRLQPLNQTALYKCAELLGKIGARETNASIKEKKYVNALAFSKMLLKNYPNVDLAHESMAIVLGRLALTKSGKEKVDYVKEIKLHAEQAVKLNPNNFKAWHVLGRWHYEVSNLNFIETTAIRLLFGGMPNASYNLAVKAFEKAAEINAKFCLNFLELAKSYHKLNQDKKAILVLKQLINLPNSNEDDPEIKLKALGYIKSWN